ncbi:MAG TPA: hypothetical protein VEA37_06890 [Flavobacterium sp.]|nr:hypothetical protein [Flavobacterium sp.]
MENPLDLKPSLVDETSINGYHVEILDLKKESPVHPFWPMYSVQFRPGGRLFVLRMAIQPIAWLELDRKVVLSWMAESAWDAYIAHEKKQLHEKIDKRANELWQPIHQRYLEVMIWLQLREMALLMKLHAKEPFINPYQMKFRHRNPPPVPVKNSPHMQGIAADFLLDLYDEAKNQNK